MTDSQPPIVPANSAHHHSTETTTPRSTIGAASSEPPHKRRRLSNPSQPLQPHTTSDIAATMSSSEEIPEPQIKVEDPSTPTTDVNTMDVNRSEPNSREAAAGIIHFLTTSNPGFCGTLKQRYVIIFFFLDAKPIAYCSLRPSSPFWEIGVDVGDCFTFDPLGALHQLCCLSSFSLLRTVLSVALLLHNH